jgi:ATP/maltotriose-dependent transcriptional regulator MalT
LPYDSTVRVSRLLPKVTPPTLGAVAPRRRLYRRIDQLLGRHAIAWISAPAGSGKTTLAASWLAARRRRCLWYQIDAADADPAALFYTLRLAVDRLSPKRRPRLPLLTPEYARGLSSYARNFFAGIASRVPEGTVIVFDNYQDVAEDAPLHGLLPPALSELPQGLRVLVLSRSAPPAAYARLVTADTIGFLGPDQLTLTVAETQTIARSRVRRPFGAGDAARLVAQTGGWMAATVLLLEAHTRVLPPRRGAETVTQQLLFDYFAAEIFDHAPAATQKLLLATAVLPEVSVPAAQALADEPRAAVILADLVRRNYFTLRLAGDEPRYRYHPLFREFLLNRARRVLDPGAWQALVGRAAELLESAGNVQDAAAILMDAGLADALARLVRGHAPDLARDGRLALLERWIKSLPTRMVDGDPWLTYWVGVCRITEVPRARASFEAAYEAFKARGDMTGALLAWAGVVGTFLIVWDEFAPLDRWIAEMETLQSAIAAFPSTEIELQVTGNMFGSLVWRAPTHPDFDRWRQRAIALLDRDAAPELKMQLASLLVFYDVTWGDYASARQIIDRVRPLIAQPEVRPLTELFWLVVEASYEAKVGQARACFVAADRGLATAEHTGVLGLSHLLALQGVYGALAAGDLATARHYLKAAEKYLDPRHRINTAHYFHLAAWIDLCAGDTARAEHHARTSADHMALGGASPGAAFIDETLAHVLITRGDVDQAVCHIDAALAWARATGSLFVEHDCLLTMAYAHLARGRLADALEWLRRGLRLGREHDFITHAWIGWRRDVMARLAAVALREGIEVEQVRAIIRARGLQAPDDAAALENWPWPIQVRTLGRFELRRDGELVAFGPKPPQKPLELLQLLIALGGEDVREERLVDCLWPDAEADAGQQSIETTLHRLRKILGSRGAIIQSGRKITLDPKTCWTDVGTLQRRLGKAHAQVDELLELYRGPLLPTVESEWVLDARERLQRQIGRVIRATAARLERTDGTASARTLLQRARDVDPSLVALSE